LVYGAVVGVVDGLGLGANKPRVNKVRRLVYGAVGLGLGTLVNDLE
jgi:hypothetical protein